MIRRRLVLLGSSVALVGAIAAATPSVNPAHIDSAWLQEASGKLAEIGRDPDGGVTRLGLSQPELDAHTYVIGLMKEAGLEVRIDPAGNIFGRRSGTAKLPVLLFGSHVDSVPHAGNFDGVLGTLGAIDVIRTLNANHVKTRHPLEVVVWTNEEGVHFGTSAFGSSAAAGTLGNDVLERKDEQGATVADWLRRYGQDAASFGAARIAPGTLAAIVELHIEIGRAHV